MKQKISTEILIKILFHTIFWGILFILPLAFGTKEPPSLPKSEVRVAVFYLFTVLSVPVFFLNSDLLIPKILHKKGIFQYVLSLFALVFLAILIMRFLREFLVPTGLQAPFLGISIIPMVFITAISTGYGMLNYLNKEEKRRQASESERLQTELSFLRSQISPHFMFNILNALVLSFYHSNLLCYAI